MCLFGTCLFLLIYLNIFNIYRNTTKINILSDDFQLEVCVIQLIKQGWTGHLPGGLAGLLGQSNLFIHLFILLLLTDWPLKQEDWPIFCNRDLAVTLTLTLGSRHQFVPLCTD